MRSRRRSTLWLGVWLALMSAGSAVAQEQPPAPPVRYPKLEPRPEPPIRSAADELRDVELAKRAEKAKKAAEESKKAAEEARAAAEKATRDVQSQQARTDISGTVKEMNIREAELKRQAAQRRAEEKARIADDLQKQAERAAADAAKPSVPGGPAPGIKDRFGSTTSGLHIDANYGTTTPTTPGAPETKPPRCGCGCGDRVTRECNLRLCRCVQVDRTGPATTIPPAVGFKDILEFLGFGDALSPGTLPLPPTQISFDVPDVYISSFDASTGAGSTPAAAPHWLDGVPDFTSQIEIAEENKSEHPPVADEKIVDAGLGWRSPFVALLNGIRAFAGGVGAALHHRVGDVSQWRHFAPMAPGLARASLSHGPAAPPVDPARVLVAFVATGNASGEAFKLRVLNRTGATVRLAFPDGLVLQPLKMTAAHVTPAFERSSRSTSVGGYCAEFAKLPPKPGSIYQVASQALQEKYRPLRNIMRAGRQLAESGGLNPDIDPAQYSVWAKQWSLWTKLEGWDQRGFAGHFLERTKKNLLQMNEKWTKETERAVRSAIPGRWQDIQRILDAAARLDVDAAPRPPAGEGH